MGWLGFAMGLRWLALGSPDRVAGGRIPLMIRDAKNESQTTRNRLHNAAFISFCIQLASRKLLWNVTKGTHPPGNIIRPANSYADNPVNLL